MHIYVIACSCLCAMCACFYMSVYVLRAWIPCVCECIHTCSYLCAYVPLCTHLLMCACVSSVYMHCLCDVRMCLACPTSVHLCMGVCLCVSLHILYTYIHIICMYTLYWAMRGILCIHTPVWVSTHVNVSVCTCIFMYTQVCMCVHVERNSRQKDQSMGLIHERPR